VVFDPEPIRGGKILIKERKLYMGFLDFLKHLLTGDIDFGSKEISGKEKKLEQRLSTDVDFSDEKFIVKEIDHIGIFERKEDKDKKDRYYQ